MAWPLRCRALYYERRAHLQDMANTYSHLWVNTKENVTQTKNTIGGRAGECHWFNFGCNWPCGARGNAGLQTHFVSSLQRGNLFYICGRDILAVLLREISKGFACSIGCELDSSSAIRSGQIWSAELYCKNGPRGKWVSSSLLGNKYTANYKWDN